MNCAICESNSSILYQCCPNEKHQLCESCCSNMISTVIDNGKIASLFNGKLPCYKCDKFIKYDRFPEKIQLDLNEILLTIPKTSKNPKLIQEFNYYYNQSNQLRHCINDKKFLFITQRHYDLLGKCIEVYIQSLIKSNQWNYEEIWLPIGNHPNHVNIFVSDDFKTNNNGCLILIQGSGVVRAGQWARSCCINESLDIGAMFPYMSKAKEHNLSVIILNPNQTSYTDDENIANNEETISPEDLSSFYLSSDPLPRPLSKPIPGLFSSREHILYVYDNIIKKYSPANKFYFVAHSAGGNSLMYLLRQRPDFIFSKSSKIAFTDSIHSIVPSDTNDLKSFLESNAIHFVASDQPMGQPIDSKHHFSSKPPCIEVSAGHSKHEYTSGYCIKGVFDYFFPSSSNVDKVKY